MKIEKKVIDVNDKQMLVLTAMAASVRFTTEIGFQLSPDVWEDDWARILSGWVVEHVRHCDTAPLAILPQMANEKADSIADEDTAESVCRYAKKLATFYEDHSSLFGDYKFLSDTSLKWIKLRNLEVLRDKMDDAIESGNLQKAEGAFRAYSEVKRVECTSIDMLRDVTAIKGAFEEDTGELFTMPGALGKMNGPFQRGDLMLVLGESGTGKSWMALQIAYEALTNGLSVLYVNLEITKAQIIRRMYTCLTARPMKSKTVRQPYFYKTDATYIDDGDEDDEDDEPSTQSVRTVYRVKQKDIEMDAVNTDSTAIQKFLMKQRMNFNGGKFQLICDSANNMTVRDLENRLDEMRMYQNFVPDLLVVDYGDLMKPENSREDKRIKVDSIYLGLRHIALDRNIMVVSPVQSNRAGYGRDMRKQDVAENIGNVNHASLLWGLSHSPKEKEMGITRVRVLKNRDSKEFADPTICIGCLDRGRLVMDSRMKKDVENISQE